MYWNRPYNPYKWYQIAVFFRAIAATLVIRKVPILSMGSNMGIIQVFVGLQLLDLLTTLVGFKLGAAEASPFIRILMHAGPATGVVLSKVLALALGGSWRSPAEGTGARRRRLRLPSAART